MSDMKYEFLLSQIKHIRDIKETQKTKISLVFYEGIQAPCIWKICKNRDLTEVYQVLMDMKHPNIAVVYDFAYANNHTYVLEEFIAGNTLSEIMGEKGLFSEKETAKIMVEVCKGLEVLHSHRPPIIHNDIKTSNIMIREDGGVKLFDFDISRLYKAGAEKNTRLFGTEEYASPEHFGFGQSEPCSDVYSLGVTMHEMLTGKGLTNEHKMTYRGRLAKIIQKCTEIDREKRYPSASQLKHDLEKYADRKRRVLPAVIICVCSVVLFAAGVLFFGRNPVNSMKQTDKNSSTLTEQDNENKGTSTEQNIGNSLTETDDNAGGISEGQSDTPTNPVINEKKMDVAYHVEGELCSMLAAKDDEFVILENVSGKYFIKTLDGREKVLEGVLGIYGARLAYDSYSGALYLFEYNNNETNVYTVDSDFEIERAARFPCKFYGDKSHLPCGFFSDGMMICNALSFQLIDSHDWSVVGEVPGMVYIVNDKMYQMQQGTFLAEVDAQEKVLNKYDRDGFFANPTYDQMYTDGRYAYFIATKDDCKYVYRFDGEAYEAIVCLNEYNYYSYFDCEQLCVTKDAVRCYDKDAKVIKEFKLN